MKTSLRLPSSRFAGREARRFAALLPILVTALACAGPPNDQPEPLEGSELVAGSSLERHGLLVLRHEGGFAEFRSVSDPSAIRWTGRVELPPISGAHGLGSAAVLRHEDGASLYATTPAETVTPLPEIPAHARWVAAGAGGAFIANAWALVVTPDRVQEITSEGEILWAAPANGDRAVALVASAGGTELLVWEGDGEAPAHRQAVASRGPVVLTGWGRHVVLPGDDGRTLQAWSIPDLEMTEGMDLGEAPGVLAASPSQHRVFASTTRPGFIEIDRYDWASVGSARTDATFTTLRPSMTGERVIGYDGAAAWTVEVGDVDPQRIPGDWRADLPIALPNGLLLIASGDEIRLASGSGEDLGSVDGPAAAAWLPFRWGPRLPVTTVVETTEDTTVASGPEAETRMSIGLRTMGTVAGRQVAAPTGPRPRVDQAPGQTAPGDAAPPPAIPSLPGGFYAVANSSRQLASLGQLRQALEGSGYSTHVLRRIDEANDTWYRLLVGPYSSRGQADAVARELRRERGIDAWIHEVIGDQ